jgi:hypothetical protein
MKAMLSIAKIRAGGTSVESLRPSQEKSSRIPPHFLLSLLHRTSQAKPVDVWSFVGNPVTPSC